MLHRYTSACVVVDRGFEILYFFGPTHEYLSQPEGEARLDLLSWVRPGLYARLRRGLNEAVEQERQVTVTGMRVERASATARVECAIEPIPPLSSRRAAPGRLPRPADGSRHCLPRGRRRWPGRADRRRAPAGAQEQPAGAAGTVEQLEDRQRGVPREPRGAALAQRGAAVEQRGARDLEGGAPVAQRGD